MKLSTIVQILKTAPLKQEAKVASISIDTRTLKKGDLFFAIKGERFDGHQFISQARAKGAVAAVVSQRVDTSLPLIHVKGTVKALGAVAHYYRSQMPTNIIAITGSCGKTTTRALTANIFGLTHPTLSSIRSFNNEIGVPLTLFNLNSTYRYAVLELGASHVGEISAVVNIASPVDVAMITCIAPAHLSGFGSMANIVRAKFEIVEGLNSKGTVVLPLREYEEYWSNYKNHTVITFGSNTARADIYAENIHLNAQSQASFDLFTPAGHCFIQLQLAGIHNVQNALAAAAAAIVKGIPIAIIKQGLESTAPVDHRLNIFHGVHGALIIDDAYNANPRAVKAAIDLLSTYDKKRILVMGDMLELGDETNRYHSTIGDYARKKNVDELFLFGELSQSTALQFGNNAHHYATHEALIDELKNNIDSQTVVLIKGSFSMNMQKVVLALTKGNQH